MSYQVNITDEADRDLRSIFEYIAYDLLSIQNAVGQLSRLQREIQALCDMPERYRRYELEPWYSRGVRRMAVDNYCVFYLPNKEAQTVTVLRVLYGRSNMDQTVAEYTD